MLNQFKNRLSSWVLGPKYGTNFADLQAPAPHLSEPRSDVSDGRASAAAPYESIRFPAIERLADVTGADRLSILRAHAPKTAKILEIGPSFSPIAAKREGYDTYIVDKADRLDLMRGFYGPDHTELHKIEDVDFVWSSPDLLDSIPDVHQASFDVVIASHVLEHISNPVKFLQALQKLLKPDGYVTLALPDKRHCFDFFRPVTTTGAWLEAFFRNDHVHTQRTMFEYLSTVVAQNLEISWAQSVLSVEATTFCGRSLHEAFEQFSSKPDISPIRYQDCHAWVFTPTSLSLLVNEVHAVGLIGLAPDFISSTNGTEFFVHLRNAHRRPINPHERLQLMARVGREQAAGFNGIAPARKRFLRPLLRRFINARKS